MRFSCPAEGGKSGSVRGSPSMRGKNCLAHRHDEGAAAGALGGKHALKNAKSSPAPKTSAHGKQLFAKMFFPLTLLTDC